jgi:hypothetical protein
MKKHFFILLFMSHVFLSYAQIAKGNYYGNINTGILFTKDFYIAANQVGLGYFITDKISLNLSTGQQLIDIADDEFYRSNTFSLGGNYFFNPTAKYKFYGSVGVRLGFGKDNLVNDDVSFTSNTFSLGGGMVFFPENNNYLGIDQTLGFTRFSTKEDDIKSSFGRVAIVQTISPFFLNTSMKKQ